MECETCNLNTVAEFLLIIERNEFKRQFFQVFPLWSHKKARCSDLK